MTRNSNTIKIALAGVGNLSSALVQAINYYKKHRSNDLMYPKIGGYTIPDFKVVAAYDIDARKVGKDLSEAIFADPNNREKLADVDRSGVTVEKAPNLDGISEYTEGVIQISDEADVDVVASLKSSEAELLVINTPSGSNKAAEFYTNAALEAGVGLINSTPSNIVRQGDWGRKFANAGLPLIGDDLQSQAGGTVFHKGVLEVLNEQGVVLEDTYQLDVSGGLEGLTTLDYDRRTLKRTTKENSIKRSLPYDIRVAAGTTDYLDFLASRRIGHFWIFGKSFMGQKIKIDIRFQSDDGGVGAASLVDAIRAAKIALTKARGGPINSICANYFKAPPSYLSRREALKAFKEF
ncbi:MAG: inositol-3-phosphate synthase, partial [Candidatus Kariarchaeaceae archaeon]